MMFSSSKSHSSLSSFVSSCLFCMAITTILIQSNDRRSNCLVEAFAQQKFTVPSRITSQTVSSSASVSSSSSSLLSTVPAPTSSDITRTSLFVSSLPDDDFYSPIVSDPLPSIIDSKTSHNQEKKKKKMWHHQDSGVESKLILAICSYHALKLLIDMIHLA